MVFKTGFRWFMFILTTAICGGTGYLLYHWFQNGTLSESGITPFLWRMALLVLPLAMCFLLSYIYNTTAGDFDMVPVAISINFFIPIAIAMLSAIQAFGISSRWYNLFQIAIPLFITYLMCLQSILFPNEPKKKHYPPRNDDYTPPTTSNNSSANSKGLATGKAD